MTNRARHGGVRGTAVDQRSFRQQVRRRSAVTCRIDWRDGSGVIWPLLETRWAALPSAGVQKSRHVRRQFTALFVSSSSNGFGERTGDPGARSRMTWQLDGGKFGSLLQRSGDLPRGVRVGSPCPTHDVVRVCEQRPKWRLDVAVPEFLTPQAPLHGPQADLPQHSRAAQIQPYHQIRGSGQ